MKKSQTSLFEGTEHDPKPKHFYNRYDLVSFLLKSIRLNRKEDALTAMWCLIQEGAGQWYIAKKLVQFASEDATGPEAFIYAQSVFQLIKDVTDEVNSLSRLIIYLCDAPKMWESEKETELEVRRIHLREKIKKQYQRGEKPIELPSYVFDVYTAKGKSAARRGEEIDRRASGVLEGSGLFCRATYLRYERLDMDDTIIAQAYSKHLLKCAKEGLHVDAYLRKHDLTIDEFLKP
ncbi:MAG: hypothetical protein Q7R81_03445 [Candidatus Peregrinibacteria bacterium]|nr:hypothetical protein [Candidatus Peregrinibacteria bacterium]